MGAVFETNQHIRRFQNSLERRWQALKSRYAVTYHLESRGNPVILVKIRNGVSYLVYMYTLGAGRILIKSIIILCFFNLMAWRASWAHRKGENEKKKIMIK